MGVCVCSKCFNKAVVCLIFFRNARYRFVCLEISHFEKFVLGFVDDSVFLNEFIMPV